MATTIQPIDHPAAWRAADIASKKDLTVELEERHLSALATGLSALKSDTCEYAEINSARFPLEGIAEDIAVWREEVYRGRGLLILKGFPVRELDIEDIPRRIELIIDRARSYKYPRNDSFSKKKYKRTFPHQ